MNSTSITFKRTADSTMCVRVLGIDVSTVDMREAVRKCDLLIGSGRSEYICAADVHSVVEAFRDPAHRRALNGAYLTVADGMPLVWVGWLRGCTRMQRVYGPDFLLEMCRTSIDRGWRHFFYGGKTGIAVRLVSRLVERFPGLQIAGTYAPPYRPLTAAEESEFTAQIEETKPDVLWVGLGAPKQEQFMAEHRGKLRCALMVGVGAAFDFHSGAVKEAPRWLHRSGLQWTYRLMQEPRRLGRRYLSCVPAFLWNAGLEAAGIRRLPYETVTQEKRTGAAPQEGMLS